jgi:hypothetical protein
MVGSVKVLPWQLPGKSPAKSPPGDFKAGPNCRFLGFWDMRLHWTLTMRAGLGLNDDDLAGIGMQGPPPASTPKLTASGALLLAWHQEWEGGIIPQSPQMKICRSARQHLRPVFKICQVLPK